MSPCRNWRAYGLRYSGLKEPGYRVAHGARIRVAHGARLQGAFGSRVYARCLRFFRFRAFRGFLLVFQADLAN